MRGPRETLGGAKVGWCRIDSHLLDGYLPPYGMDENSREIAGRLQMMQFLLPQDIHQVRVWRIHDAQDAVSHRPGMFVYR